MSARDTLGQYDNTIRTGSVRPVYPAWMKRKVTPELEAKGPAEYDLSIVELWLHDSQKNRDFPKGWQIYDHLLKSNGMLESCLGLRDGLAIGQKGIEVFHKFFGDNTVFLWASVLQHLNGRLVVPCLIDYCREVLVGFRFLDCPWRRSDPAARFLS
ncbi:MAG TPA: hypothetical protein VMU27_01580 [Candidatus Paceibacterota bacterium]|nr:hypothetical protein [Candidatus Paceibacterota bacterium]